MSNPAINQEQRKRSQQEVRDAVLSVHRDLLDLVATDPERLRAAGIDCEGYGWEIPETERLAPLEHLVEVPDHLAFGESLIRAQLGAIATAPNVNDVKVA